MALRLPEDFSEFLRLLDAKGVEYLLIGGYAVGYHGYPRATKDLDLWVARTPENAARLVTALREFGFNAPDLAPDLFLAEGRIVRMGMPPLRIEVATTISGVEFADCWAARVEAEFDGVPVKIIGREHLKRNKRASGRHQDLADLEHLE